MEAAGGNKHDTAGTAGGVLQGPAFLTSARAGSGQRPGRSP